MSEKLCVGKALDMLLGYETDVYGPVNTSEIPALAERFGLVTSITSDDDEDGEWHHHYEVRVSQPHILLIETDEEEKKGHAQYVRSLIGYMPALLSGKVTLVGLIHAPYEGTDA